ncbi:unnamed protein product [Plutella xylostella]|uniref:(diamondback moth) hypothetical protein n=1 Tax=Plutella xylostella TaxID=51655 RepID=A0A8S4G2C1_PLUXY|nr:unnamed protein product [Plutella xylostella]
MLSGTTAVVYWTDPTLPKGQTATDGRRYVVRWAGAGKTRFYNATDLNCMLDDLRPFTPYEFAVKLIKACADLAHMGQAYSAAEKQSAKLLVRRTCGEAPQLVDVSRRRRLFRELTFFLVIWQRPRVRLVHAGHQHDARSAPRVPPARPPRRAPAGAGGRGSAVELTWGAPAKPNGIITGYVIMYVSAGAGGAAGAEWTASAVLGDRRSTRVDRLRARTKYFFKLQARNSAGLGPFTQLISFTTGEDSNEGGGLSGATSAWLWASAGGALAVLALAAALALSLCCRRPAPHEPIRSQYCGAASGAASGERRKQTLDNVRSMPQLAAARLAARVDWRGARRRRAARCASETNVLESIEAATAQSGARGAIKWMSAAVATGRAVAHHRNPHRPPPLTPHLIPHR